MKITVLAENKETDLFFTEHGFSLYIDGPEKILFDTGASDIFLKNASELGIRLDDLDLVVLSHGHYDHGNGLKHIKYNRLLCHPNWSVKNYLKKDRTFCGINADFQSITKQVDVIETKKPYQISEKIVFLGEIPRLNDFESKHTSFVDGHGNDYFMPDDSALAIRTLNGLVILTGCAHSGICNICEYAKKVMHMDDIHILMGGFHLQENNDVLKKTIDYLSKQNIDELYPLHCVKEEILQILIEKLSAKKIFTGNTLCFDT